MTDREKLVELLKSLPQVNHAQAAVEGLDYVFGCAADYLIANGVTVQRWIRVTEEEIPDMECIAVGFQNEMLIGWIAPDAYSDTGYSTESDGEVLHNVTHWMPLPPAPEDMR